MRSNCKLIELEWNCIQDVGKEANQHVESLRLSTKFRLGGVLLLENTSDEAADMLFKLLVGIQIPHNDTGSIYMPPYLNYVYCPDIPVLFEGSILKNLLLGARHALHGTLPTDAEAWELAKMCGLDAEFIGAPDTFNVGKAGRNLPLAARQSISLARSLISDPCVLLLHKPVSLLQPKQAAQVILALNDFVEFGGLWGMLSRNKRPHG
jgi:hypothetical protein